MIIMIILILIILIILTIEIFIIAIASSSSGRRMPAEDENIETNTEDMGDFYLDTDTDKGHLPSKTVFAVYGVDAKEALSDVIIVASFDRVKNTINTVSVPRDTYVVMSDENRKELKELGKNIPSGGMKINAVHSLSGEYGNEYLSRQLEEMLNIHIDYYFEINLDGFTKTVDLIGGVEVDVPVNMRYSDPTQDLYINIKKGRQVLDGKKAQQFVRYRRFLKGDIDRIESQKAFLKAFMEKITSSETILSNLPELIGIFFENVNTNMTIKDALDYAPYIKNTSAEKITMETLPGNGETPYKLYDNQVRVLINKLFFDVEPAEDSENET